MKNTREIKVAVLAIVCGCLLYFGFNFLKGVNIFAPTRQFVAIYENIGGLTEQAPVYVRGYKVGQVDLIQYDFSKQQAFTVTISVDKHILIPEGSQFVLADDGLLGGKAIILTIPVGTETEHFYAKGDTIPTSVELGLLASLQEGLMGKLSGVMSDIDSLVLTVNNQLADNHLQASLQHVDMITDQLSVSASDIRNLTHNQLPGLVENADSAIANINYVAADLRDADLKATVARLNTTVDTLNAVLSSQEGTLGLLLNDKALYQHIDSTVVSVDSLINDLKAHPKRYVHFSVFGKKDK
ncbi:MAG: MlaD family protein [Paludibacteraceae bacterium]|nr:MlaD family protein [Paludibacteraceae bacterium]